MNIFLKSKNILAMLSLLLPISLVNPSQAETIEDAKNLLITAFHNAQNTKDIDDTKIRRGEIETSMRHDLVELLTHIAGYQALVGDKGTALKTYQKAISLGINGQSYMEDVVESQAQAGLFDIALENVTKIQRKGGVFYRLLDIADSQYTAGLKSDSLKTLEKALSFARTEKDVYLLSTMATTYSFAGEPDAALKILDEINSIKAWPIKHIALELYKENRESDAQKLIAKLDGKKQTEVYEEMAFDAFSSGMQNLSSRLFKIVIAKKKHDDAPFLIDDIYLKISDGQFFEAIREIQTVQSPRTNLVTIGIYDDPVFELKSIAAKQLENGDSVGSQETIETTITLLKDRFNGRINSSTVSFELFSTMLAAKMFDRALEIINSNKKYDHYDFLKSYELASLAIKQIEIGDLDGAMKTFDIYKDYRSTLDVSPPDYFRERGKSDAPEILGKIAAALIKLGKREEGNGFFKQAEDAANEESSLISDKGLAYVPFSKVITSFVEANEISEGLKWISGLKSPYNRAHCYFKLAEGILVKSGIKLEKPRVIYRHPIS